MSDIQEMWETYKGFRLVPYLLQFDDCNQENSGKWIAASVEIKSARDGTPVKSLNLNGLYACSESEAFLLAVNAGKKEIDNPAFGVV